MMDRLKKGAQRVKRGVRGVREVARIGIHLPTLAGFGRSAYGIATNRRSSVKDLVGKIRPDKITIIGVNGLASNAAYMGLMLNDLRADFNVILPDFQDNLDSLDRIRDQANSLAKFSHDLILKTDVGEMVYVGHSIGGDVALDMINVVEEEGLDEVRGHIGGVLTLASPIHLSPDEDVSDLHHLFRSLPAADDLCDREFYKRISRQHGMILSSIVTGEDMDTIVPSRMQKAPGRPFFQRKMPHNPRKEDEPVIARHVRSTIFSLAPSP